MNWNLLFIVSSLIGGFFLSVYCYKKIKGKWKLCTTTYSPNGIEHDYSLIRDLLIKILILCSSLFLIQHAFYFGITENWLIPYHYFWKKAVIIIGAFTCLIHLVQTAINGVNSSIAHRIRIHNIKNVALKNENSHLDTKVINENMNDNESKIDYRVNYQKLIDNNIIVSHDVYDYTDTEVKDRYDPLFQFYQKHLNENFGEFKINPAILFYNNNHGVNGWAHYVNGFYVISINKGTIYELHKIFIEQRENIAQLKELRKFGEGIAKTAYRTMHNTATHFLFYHEVGHLIQRSTIEERLYSDMSDKKVFDINNHKNEFDSDIFSSIMISRHILVAYSKLDPILQDAENLKTIITLSCVGAGIYRLFYLSRFREMYYEKHTHPHIMIRCISIINTIYEYTNKQYQTDYGQTISDSYLSEITINTFELLERVYNLVYDDISFGYFKSIIGSEGNKLSKYYMKLGKLVEEDPESAISKRNKLIEDSYGM